MTLEQLKEAHIKLRSYRYWYYEKSKSLITDYEYDMLEKEYEQGCDKLNIPTEDRVTNFVGFDIRIPMNISPKKG